MICCGIFCGSKQDHALSNTFQILENMKFWKISAWENFFADKVIGLREEELKYCFKMVQVAMVVIMISSYSVTIWVSNFCG